MKKNIIVVTGGAGFIASNLIKLFIKKTNYKFISIDNYYSGSKKNHINSKKVIYLRGHTKNINKILYKYKSQIHSIFHFGEFSRIYQSFEHRNECFDFNMTGTIEVIKFCCDNKIKIYYSASSSKFGNSGKDENLSPYSWTKSKNIEIIKNFSKWFNLKYEILYFYNVYGPGQIKNHKMSAVIGIFEEKIEKKLPLPVVLPGNQKRDFTHVYDIVRGCYLAFKKGKNSEYMLGTNKSNSVLKIAKMFSKNIKFIKERKGERLGSYSFRHSTYKDLGYKAKINIEDYIKNFKKNLNY